jgi:hypothetical protein
MLLDSFCVPNVPQYTITTAASDFVPLGRILPLKPTKKGPNHNDAKTLSLFLYVLQLVSCRPKPRFIFISRKIRTKTERASYQAIDRPSDRSIERFSDFFFQTVFSSGNTFWPPL